MYSDSTLSINNIFDNALFKRVDFTLPSERTDFELIQSIFNGNLDDFSEIIHRYYQPIYRYALRSLNFHEQDAEDLTAETFMKAYTFLRSYSPKNSFSSWLYKIAHNLIIDKYRSHKGTVYRIEDYDTIKISDINLDFPSGSGLEHVLSKLQDSDRQLLILHYLEGLSLKEISKIYRVFPHTIKSRLHKARERAKKILHG